MFSSHKTPALDPLNNMGHHHCAFHLIPVCNLQYYIVTIPQFPQKKSCTQTLQLIEAWFQLCFLLQNMSIRTVFNIVGTNTKTTTETL